MKQETIFSPCHKYRYTLWREWGCDLFEGDGVNRDRGYAMFIGLNPSTADETKDDPTIRRCIGFARDWGYGALCMTNLFAFRATQPDDMKAASDPTGPDNDFWLQAAGVNAGVIIAAWGVHGIYRNRAQAVTQLLSGEYQLHHLGLTKDGHPKHPLYLPKSLKPEMISRPSQAPLTVSPPGDTGAGTV